MEKQCRQKPLHQLTSKKSKKKKKVKQNKKTIKERNDEDEAAFRLATEENKKEIEDNKKIFDTFSLAKFFVPSRQNFGLRNYQKILLTTKKAVEIKENYYEFFAILADKLNECHNLEQELYQLVCRSRGKTPMENYIFDEDYKSDQMYIPNPLNYEERYILYFFTPGLRRTPYKYGVRLLPQKFKELIEVNQWLQTDGGKNYTQYLLVGHRLSCLFEACSNYRNQTLGTQGERQISTALTALPLTEDGKKVFINDWLLFATKLEKSGWNDDFTNWTIPIRKNFLLLESIQKEIDLVKTKIRTQKTNNQPHKQTIRESITQKKEENKQIKAEAPETSYKDILLKSLKLKNKNQPKKQTSPEKRTIPKRTELIIKKLETIFDEYRHPFLYSAGINYFEDQIAKKINKLYPHEKPINIQLRLFSHTIDLLIEEFGIKCPVISPEGKTYCNSYTLPVDIRLKDGRTLQNRVLLYLVHPKDQNEKICFYRGVTTEKCLETFEKIRRGRDCLSFQKKHLKRIIKGASLKKLSPLVSEQRKISFTQKTDSSHEKHIAEFAWHNEKKEMIALLIVYPSSIMEFHDYADGLIFSFGKLNQEES